MDTPSSLEEFNQEMERLGRTDFVQDWDAEVRTDEGETALRRLSDGR